METHQPPAVPFGLTKLPPHLPVLILSFLGFLLVHQVIAPVLSRRWFPDAFASKSKAARNAWCIHVVSQAHVVVVIPLSLWCLLKEDKERDLNRAFGWDERVGLVHAISCGYFIWDTLDAIVNFTDLGFVLHGLACSAIYGMSFKPFVAYYGTRCLLWEASTFFLNIHWFLDKTKRTGSTFQLVNGGFLLTVFFFVRLVYGGKVSYDFFVTLYEVYNEIPLSYVVVYGSGNFLLQGLNYIWFWKMITALRKRFNGDQHKKHGNGNGHAITNGNGNGIHRKRN